eukprot:403088-Amphidinium_carterae.1
MTCTACMSTCIWTVVVAINMGRKPVLQCCEDHLPERQVQPHETILLRVAPQGTFAQDFQFET